MMIMTDYTSVERVMSRKCQESVKNAQRGTCNGGQTQVSTLFPPGVQLGTDPGFAPVPAGVQRGTDLGFHHVPAGGATGDRPGFPPCPRLGCNWGQTRVSTLSPPGVQLGTDPGFHPVPAWGATGDRPRFRHRFSPVIRTALFPGRCGRCGKMSLDAEHAQDYNAVVRFGAG